MSRCVAPDVKQLSSSSSGSAILQLPLEVRLQIYDLVSDNTSTTNSAKTSLLQVCHQIRSEALPVFWKKRTFSFKSLEKFLFWSLGEAPGHKQYVRHVDFEWRGSPGWTRGGETDRSWDLIRGFIPFIHTTKADMDQNLEPSERWRLRYAELCDTRQETLNQLGSSIFEVFERPYRPKTSRITNAQLSQSEERNAQTEPAPLIHLLWNALKDLRGVQTLWVNFSTEWSSCNERLPDFTAEQQLVLEMISEAMPNVRRLAFASHPVALDFLRNFSKLQSLSTSPISKSSPSETLQIVQTLSNLEEIEFPSWYTLSAGYPLEQRSFTDETLRRTAPLKRLGFPINSDLEATLENVVALETHSASITCLHLYWYGLQHEFEGESETEVFRFYGDTLSSASQLERVNVWSQSARDWQELSNMTFSPVSLRGNPSGSWFVLKSYTTEEVWRLAAMST